MGGNFNLYGGGQQCRMLGTSQGLKGYYLVVRGTPISKEHLADKLS